MSADSGVAPNHYETLRLLFPRVPIAGALDDDLAVDGRSLDAAQLRAEDLLTEMIAGTARELLPSWERVCGLTPGADWPLQRRLDAVVRKLRSLGDIKKPYFVALALDLGYEITIDDYVPAMAGWMRAGDTVYIPDAIYIWRVEVLDQPVYYFRAGQSSAGERLTWWPPATDLEAMLNDLKPAEVYLHFVYP